MIYSQYLRIESKAGGVCSTNRQFIKACHSVLHKRGKKRDMRENRHSWIKSGLELKKDALKTYIKYR